MIKVLIVLNQEIQHFMSHQPQMQQDAQSPPGTRARGVCPGFGHTVHVMLPPMRTPGQGSNTPRCTRSIRWPASVSQSRPLDATSKDKKRRLLRVAVTMQGSQPLAPTRLPMAHEMNPSDERFLNQGHTMPILLNSQKLKK